MKKILLLLALGALLALPAFALAETWAEFVDLAEEAMAGQIGVVSLHAPAVVTALPGGGAWNFDGVPPEVLEKPLVVPDGVRLTIQGGVFEIMMLGGGQVTLSGATVTGLPDTDAILISPQGKEGHQKLTIDAGSTVTAGGPTGRALSCTRWNIPGSLEIENLGTITAERAACADLRMTPESGNAVLRIRNAGTIRGGGNGILLLLHPVKGAGSAALENTGTLTAAGDTAVSLAVRSDKRGAFATLENRSGATIAQTGPEGAAVVMEVTDTAGGASNGQGLIINQGIIRAGTEPIRLLARADAPVPVRIQQIGLVEETSGKIAPAAYIYLSAVAGETLKTKDLEALGETWAENLDLGAMPTGTRMELVALDKNGAEQQRHTVRSEGTSVRPAMAWKEFRAWAEEQLALSPGGELRLHVHAEVGAPKGMDSGRDKGLTIPAGKQLTLVGGAYEHILLANGDLTLSGVEARCLSIPAGEDALLVNLTIGEDSVLTATGAGQPAIYTEPKQKKASDITILNLGRVESEDRAIDLSAAVVGDREVRLTVSNQGKILSRGQAVRLRATTQNGPATLTLTNDGVAESTGTNAVELTGLSSKNSCWFLVQNGPEGNLRCSTGNALTIRTLDPEAKAANPRERVPGLEEPWGSVTIENQGKIGGKEAPIQVECLLRALFPVEVRGRGEVAGGGDAPDFLFTALYHAEKADRVLPEAEFDTVVRGHTEAELQLPDGLHAQVRMRVPATASISEELYLYEGDL